MVPRAGFEPATTPEVAFSSYDDFLNDLEDFKLFAKSKLNFSQEQSIITRANLELSCETEQPLPTRAFNSTLKRRNKSASWTTSQT